MRWFVLNTDYGTLDYYGSQGDDRPKGSIGLLSAGALSVVPNRKHCFSIVTPNRSYCVSASTDEEMKEWMDAIQAARSALLEHYQQEIKDKVKKEVLIAGHLTKQGKNVLGDWRRRWCILRTDALHYYKSEADTSTHKEKGHINMLVASVKPSALRRYAFEVITPSRSYHFQASSQEEMLGWIDKIREASEKLLHALPIEAPFTGRGPSAPPASSSSSPPPSSSSSSSSIPPSASSSSSPPSNDGTAANPSPDRSRLSELLLLPANQYCADCGQSEPRWATVSLGLFICIECSGIHRSLGVQHSRVRSVDLDHWDAHAVQKMAAMGNARGCDVWEHHVPADWASRKPVPSAPRAQKEAWIRAKYVEGLFAHPERRPRASDGGLQPQGGHDATPPS